jgi:hypothetical protein
LKKLFCRKTDALLMIDFRARVFCASTEAAAFFRE